MFYAVCLPKCASVSEFPLLLCRVGFELRVSVSDGFDIVLAQKLENVIRHARPMDGLLRRLETVEN